MKKVLSAAVLSVSLAFSSVAFAEPQPNMKAALEHLRHAKESLEKATPDKGGHRVKALELVSKAIEATEKGIAYDAKH